MKSPKHVHIAYRAFEEKLVSTVDTFDAQKVLLVTGEASFERSGAAAIVRQQIGDRIADQFTDFNKNPTIADIESGVLKIREIQPDLILAIGGGSSLDVAKQTNFCATNPFPPREYITGKANPESPGLPLVACPTTAGTGSEATHFAVCYDGMDKYSFAHPNMKPDAVIVDPSLANSLPPYQAACCAFDALSQLIESYWAVGSTEESRAHASLGLSTISRAILPAVLEKNPQAQLELAHAAFLSGKAIDISKTTAAHALSYPISQLLNLPHGHSVAVTLPELLEVNKMTTSENCIHPFGPEFVKSVIRKISATLPKNLSLHDIAEKIGLFRQRTKLGMGDSQTVKKIASYVNTQRLSNNPQNLSNTTIERILNGNVH